MLVFCFFFQAEDGIRDSPVTGVQTCALPISVAQGEKFDPKGAYVRRWVPELASLPDVWVHKPWLAPTETLEHAGLRLGTDYPEPIVDHASSRLIALSGFQSIKRNFNSEDEITRDMDSG